MTIPFKHIPSNLRVPLFYAEVDNSQANSSVGTNRALIMAQITASGIATPGVPILSAGVADAINQGGAGSMLHLMVQAYRAADPFGELWLLPLADDGSATAAGGSINITHVATANGTLALYIAGQSVPLAVSSAQTAAQIATALVAAVNANTSLPVTAAIDGSITTKVDFTAKNKGLNGNDIDIRLNYYGAPNEALPVGLTATIVAMSGGATNPSLTSALATLPTQSYDFIVNPFTDATSLTKMTAYLNDSTGTWSWDEKLYGHAFSAYRGTVSALVTFGTGLNDQHTSVMGFYDSPTPAWVIAADFAATSATSLRVDPALPLQTLQLSTVLPPPLASRFVISDQNTLLYDGISTFSVGDDGSVRIQRAITTYQTNAFGSPDNSYNSIETLFNLAFILRNLNGIVTSRYARVKLAADGTKFSAGSAIVTPSTIRGDLIAEYQQLELDGFVQDSEAFAAGLIVSQNAQNPNRVDVLWDGTLINQLNIFALLAQFRL